MKFKQKILFVLLSIFSIQGKPTVVFESIQSSGCRLFRKVLKTYFARVGLDSYSFDHNHDMRNKFVIDSTVKHVVQYRKDPILQLMAIKRLMEKSFLGPCWESFDEFLKSKIGQEHQIRVRNFINKYFLNHPCSHNVYYLEYYDFVENPYFHLKNILINVFEVSEVDESILKEIILEENIKLRNKDNTQVYRELIKKFPKPIRKTPNLNVKKHIL